MRALTLLVAAASTARVHAEFFAQTVDHSLVGDTSTFAQQYNVSGAGADGAWDPAAPVFLFLGGEAPLGFFDFQTVMIREWADELGANYVALEHRYYGASVPAEYTVSELSELLSVDQALADASEFITWAQSDASALGRADDAPWVVFGASYSAALAAWFRSKYNAQVVGAVAASAPMFAVANWTAEYNNFENVAPSSCVAAAASAVEAVEGMIADPTGTGVGVLESVFNISTGLLSDSNMDFFRWTLTDALSTISQMSNPAPMPFEPAGPWIMDEMCDILTGDGALPNCDDMGSIVPAGKVVAVDYPLCVSRMQQAFDYAIGGATPTTTAGGDFNQDAALTALQSGSSLDDQADRAWTWQVCAAFGWFGVSYSHTAGDFAEPTSIWFDIDLSFFEDLDTGWCAKVFDQKAYLSPDQIEARIDAFNALYGGIEDYQATNVIFSNGDLDPWRLVSIRADNKPAALDVSTVEYAAGHCAPFTEPTDDDPASLTKARTRIASFLQNMVNGCDDCFGGTCTDGVCAGSSSDDDDDDSGSSDTFEYLFFAAAAALVVAVAAAVVFYRRSQGPPAPDGFTPISS